MLSVLASVLAVSGVVTSQGLGNPAISETVYDNIVTYSKFAAASYADACATPFGGASVLSYFNDASTDTQATLFLYPAAQQVVIAFRGTSTPADFTVDLEFLKGSLTGSGTKCTSCRVHKGFQKSWESIQSSVITAVNNALASHPGYSLIVTGHSLGGAIASLASASFAASGKSPTVYTYGEPRNGNSAFSTYINGLIPNTKYFRVTHANDGVPRIPPKILGYQHHGTEYWQKPMSGISAASTYMCAGAEPASCVESQNYGRNPINGAHISYSNDVIGNSLFVHACGAVTP